MSYYMASANNQVPCMYLILLLYTHMCVCMCLYAFPSVEEDLKDRHQGSKAGLFGEMGCSVTFFFLPLYLLIFFGNEHVLYF